MAVPKARSYDRFRRKFSLLTVTMGIVVSLSAFGNVACEKVQAAQPDPILFVHGWGGHGSNFAIMKGRFEHDGWAEDRLYSFSYNFAQSNVETADEIKAEVEDILARTGADKVDIVAHSMGAMGSRYYLKNLGGTAQVDDWVSFGGANHGTIWANACFLTSCVELRRSSAFLDALNAGDETPGDVNYGAAWSSCDEIILPNDGAKLSGATEMHVGCVEHALLLAHSHTYSQIRDFVR